MNDRMLKQLAALSVADDGMIDETAQRYVLEKLSRADLKRYVLYLRNVLRSRQVQVRSAAALDAAAQKRVAAVFPGKDLRYAVDPSLGAGLQVEYGDNLVNVNVRAMIQNTLRQLKEKL